MIRFPHQRNLHAVWEIQLRMIAHIRPSRQHGRAGRARQLAHVAGGSAHAAQAHLAEKVEAILVQRHHARLMLIERARELVFAIGQHRVE